MVHGATLSDVGTAPYCQIWETRMYILTVFLSLVATRPEYVSKAYTHAQN